MGDLIERDKIYKAVYDLACASAGVIDGICEDYAYGLREAAHMIEEAPAVDAVPMTHDLDSSDLIRRKDVLWITKETGALETQNRVRELPAVDAVPIVRCKYCVYGEPCKWPAKSDGYYCTHPQSAKTQCTFVLSHDKNHYCDSGKRREEEQNGK